MKHRINKKKQELKIEITGHYLNFPVDDSKEKTTFRLSDQNNEAFDMLVIRLAEGDPDFWG